MGGRRDGGTGRGLQPGYAMNKLLKKKIGCRSLKVCWNFPVNPSGLLLNLGGLDEYKISIHFFLIKKIMRECFTFTYVHHVRAFSSFSVSNLMENRLFKVFLYSTLSFTGVCCDVSLFNTNSINLNHVFGFFVFG